MFRDQVLVSARKDAPRNARKVSSCPRDCCCDRYGYYEQGGLADMDDDVRVMELVEDTVSQEPRLLAREKRELIYPLDECLTRVTREQQQEGERIHPFFSSFENEARVCLLYFFRISS